LLKGENIVRKALLGFWNSLMKQNGAKSRSFVRGACVAARENFNRYRHPNLPGACGSHLQAGIIT
jgi:hypothetical protein